MCTMGNISFYILLIFAVQHSFSINDKRGIPTKSKLRSDVDFEEEAVRDIESLLKNKKNNNIDENDVVDKNIYEPRSIYEGNERLKKQLENILKRLNIKKKIDSIGNEVKALRSGNNMEIEDLRPSARYKQFINNLDLNHRDIIKNKVTTIVGDSKFDDMFKTDKNNRFEQIMKNLRSHRGYSMTNSEHNLDFMDKTLRQRVDYADIKPDIYTTIILTDDQNIGINKGPGYNVPKQHELINIEKDVSEEIKPIMRAHLIPKPDNYGQFQQIDLKHKYNNNTGRENWQSSSNYIDKRNEFWKQLAVREKRKVPLSQANIIINNAQMDELVKKIDTNKRQDSKSIGDSLRFRDIINPENNDILPRVLKTSNVRYREDIRHPDKNWPELLQMITTNRIEDMNGDDSNHHHNNWQNNRQKLGVTNTDDVNYLIFPDASIDWKKQEENSYAERKDHMNDLLNSGTDWETLLKRFNISRIGETSDESQLNGQQRITGKLDIHYKENKNDMIYKVNHDGGKFLANPDTHLRAPLSVAKKLSNEGTLHKADSHNNRPQEEDLELEIPINSVADSQEHHGRRTKRSAFTQAGYTHDPDICKLYNENLVKLWSNLSKLINATEQPNERALHNIVVMIEAYLEHQNLKQATDTVKVKHEGTRDKTTEVLLRIKKLLDDNEGNPEKITKIIVKYIKPFYGDVENKECQQVNEESLASSVELLYKNYVENTDCHNEGEGLARNKELVLRKLAAKNTKSVSNDWHTTNTEYKPELKSILSEAELYKDFHRGRMPRQRPITKNRRVLKRGRKPQASRPIYRSGDQNINSEKPKTRSKVHRSIKKLKKSSRKSDLEKNRCEKYTIRRFIVSLRPVIERFLALLECQLDNTLRSYNFDKVSNNPYYLYASNFYSNEASRREKKVLPRMKIIRKHSERSRNISPRKFQDMYGYDVSNETEKAIFVRDGITSFPLLRKYSFDQTTASDSSDIRDANSNDNSNNEVTTSYNEYIQSPPLYDEYDGIYKTHSSTYPSFINPLISVNKNKNIEEKPINSEKLTITPLYEEYPEEPKYIMNVSDQQYDSNYTDESGFTDFTKLKDDKHVVDTNLEHRENTVKKLESITEFLQKARDESLQTPEFAVPFALDSNKGYVELTHLVKYPKMLVYRPQFIVKNTMPYDDFLKTVNSFNMTNDEVRLMKIVRHLPDSSVKVLFETEDFESPLEVRNIKEYRRSGSQNYPLESGTDTVNINFDENTDFTDENSDESLITMYSDEVHSKFMDILFKPDEYRSGEDDLKSAAYLNVDPNSENNSTLSNSALNLTLESGRSLEILPSLASSLISNIPGLRSNTSVGEVRSSEIGTGSDTALSLDSLSSLDSPFQLNPVHSSELNSYLSKFLPHSSSHSDSDLQMNLNSHSQLKTPVSASTLHSYFSSNPLLSSTKSNSDSSSLEIVHAKKDAESDSILPPSSQPPENRWWKWWKDLFKLKIKKIVGNMATLADNIDHIVKL